MVRKKNEDLPERLFQTLCLIPDQACASLLRSLVRVQSLFNQQELPLSGRHVNAWHSSPKLRQSSAHAPALLTIFPCSAPAGVPDASLITPCHITKSSSQQSESHLGGRVVVVVVGVVATPELIVNPSVPDAPIWPISVFEKGLHETETS